MKKIIYGILALVGGGVISTTLMATEDTDGSQPSFEQQPPIPKNFFVQKLGSPLEGGENMILRVQYYVDSTLPESINIFEDGEHTKTLKDDGVFPDSVAGDFIYATYLMEDIDMFIEDIDRRETQIATDGGVYHFEGHDGEFIKQDLIPSFNYTAFASNIQVPIYFPLLDVTDCENTILKQNSLFITDLSVVEDPARTYKLYDVNASPSGSPSGNPNGAWTFGQLMKNMANTSETGISTKDFLKAWVKNWRSNQQIGTFAYSGNNPDGVPYDNVVPRRAIDNFIAPWIKKARNITDPNYNPVTSTTTYDWESEWDGTIENDLIQNSPFKLMAIVNRLDTRGNPAYSGNITNAGETRFIFTLIDPTTGYPPSHPSISSPLFGAQTNSGIDWVGMNVILEFGNPFSSTCDLKLFAQQWYDLSAYTLGSDEYKDHLQAITDQVTASGAGGSKNLNKSAIDQIRTNEKVFTGVNSTPPVGDWEIGDWEMRQFELADDGYLQQAVVTNTPVDERPDIISFNGTTGIMGHSFNIAENVGINDGSNINADLLSWIYGSNGTSINRIRASMGNHNLPEPFLGGVARIYKEMAHSFGFDWNNLPSGVYNSSTYDQNSDIPDLLAKKIRHQISLNTCQGCHSGETKTNFTQMMPRGYGEPAKYWDPTPDVLISAENHSGLPVNSIDARFGPLSTGEINNSDFTFDVSIGSTGGLVPNLDFYQKANNTTCQIISPFLTGRLYSSQTTGLWQDDELNDANNEAPLFSTSSTSNYFLSDEKLTGLYWVNDPSNEASTITLSAGKGGNFPQLHTKRWGFNDLLHRQNDLCAFINSNCNGSLDSPTTIDILKRISIVPGPKGGH